MLLRALISLVVVLTSSCAGMSAARRAALEAEAQPAYAALQAARFEDAQRLADEVLAKTKDNPRAAAVSALARYRKAGHDLVGDGLTIFASVVASALARGDVINQDFLDFALGRADKRLEEIDGLLAIAEKDDGFSLDLCLACWEVDWNRSGEVDERDRRLFEVELDVNGEQLPPDDPRRRPTFRFDVADVTWLRAMVHFQRAVLNLGLAYDPNVTWRSRSAEVMTLKLRDATKVLKAKELLLAALAHADRCRLAVLAETDDVREWVPNPKQRDHALPLPVDEALFETWRGVLVDVRALLNSEQGLDVPELAQLGNRKWRTPPPGFLDLGAFFSQPRDFVVDERAMRGVRHDDPGAVSEMLGRILGPSYRRAMPPSPLIQRLVRMSKEIDRGEESFERKLRYLLWLN